MKAAVLSALIVRGVRAVNHEEFYSHSLTNPRFRLRCRFRRFTRCFVYRRSRTMVRQFRFVHRARLC